MSKVEVCDLCDKPIMERFEDSAYRVTIKEMLHFYDGYVPWRGKRTCDVCASCIQKIIISTSNKKETKDETK